MEGLWSGNIIFSNCMLLQCSIHYSYLSYVQALLDKLFLLEVANSLLSKCYCPSANSLIRLIASYISSLIIIFDILIVFTTELLTIAMQL